MMFFKLVEKFLLKDVIALLNISSKTGFLLLDISRLDFYSLLNIHAI